MNKNDNIILDIVYTYVDGNDKRWLKQKKKDCNINSVCRYNSDLDEIKYSVYSVEKYFKNQFRNIYFVTNNGKLPKCIKPKDNYIPLLYSDLVGYRTYNSTVIEANLHKIEGLAEYYLYFNDDFILMRKLKKSDFIEKKTGKLIWYKESNKLFNFAIKYPNITSNTVKFFFNKSDSGCIESRDRIYNLLNIKDKIDGQIGHNPHIYKKSMVIKICTKFNDELIKNKDRIIRSEDDFPMNDIFCFYYLKKNKIIFTDKYKTKILAQFDNIIFSKIYNHLDNSHFLCVEDVRKEKKIDSNVKKILDKKFKKIKDMEII
tara:strand:+ start:2055 stop:3002 length:948 start_codon:yes stop_codon:yes gene_type:complete